MLFIPNDTYKVGRDCKRLLFEVQPGIKKLENAGKGSYLYFFFFKYFQFSSYKTNVNIIAIAQTETKIKGYDMRILFNINLKAL